MPVSVSTDPIRPSERRAFWTEAICRSFANVETKPLGPGPVSGHFEFVEVGRAKLVRFDSSPQCYSRDVRLVSQAGSDDFMFDVQVLGRSRMTQCANEGMVEPGFGVLYDARRPFEDRLGGPERAEVLIATVPAAALLAAFPLAEDMCARAIPLSGAVSHTITALIRAAILEPGARAVQHETDIVSYLAALLRQARGGPHGLDRPRLFALIDIQLRRNLARVLSPPALAIRFGISERTFHRLFADRGTTFERHLLLLRVERLHGLLSLARLSHVPIASLAAECGFADAAHASRTFKRAFDATPREYRAAALANEGGLSDGQVHA